MGWCGLTAYIMAIGAISKFSDRLNTAAYIGLCSILFVVAVAIWSGIKYGEQKGKFWL